ncbi:nuclear transport factor 2 family protein [Amycolatopsis alkalitolerans]|uniref:Nuclear transport factor 2 family protein n=1 Tax=Amycolatopsis alkalitolerans TaxID=2547244 RepID=A0A5C4LP70_9PSEU|nr:nuclear transport factor 2 family protein [Amycolatopsis alkalitolerans]TNC18717.1 nuclear transport factor 2 family protein [Amycolatopsis alkalitolerans]
MSLALDRSLIADRLELSDLLARLSRAVDRADRAGIIACYAEESYDDHGAGFKGSGREFADYICGGSPTSAQALFLLHHLGQQLFDIEGDEAFGETAYMMDMKTGDGKFVHACGRYLDYFQRIDGRWRVKYRRVVSEWTGAIDADEFPRSDTQLRSARDRSDPLYDRKRWPDSV